MWAPIASNAEPNVFAHFYSSDEHWGSSGCAGDEVQGGQVGVIFSSSIPLKRPTAAQKMTPTGPPWTSSPAQPPLPKCSSEL